MPTLFVLEGVADMACEAGPEAVLLVALRCRVSRLFLGCDIVPPLFPPTSFHVLIRCTSKTINSVVTSECDSIMSKQAGR